MRTVQVRIDQAVWERQHVEIEVPDNVSDADLAEYVIERCDECEYEWIETEILTIVESISTEYQMSVDGGINFEEIP